MSDTTEVAVREETGMAGIEDDFGLELKIIDAVVGKITTNAAQVLEAAKLKCADYQDIERFVGNEDLAKKERATLNKAVKRADEEAKRIKDLWMAPLNEFDSTMKQVKAVFKTASGSLDELVKNVEAKEKAAKTEAIKVYFYSKKFDLVPFDQIFNERWLLKGTKMPEIRKDIDALINKVYGDLKIIEKIADYGTQAKAFYLESLDMGAAMQKVDNLRAAAEKVAKEQAEREERERQAQVQKNVAEARQEERSAPREERIHDLVAEALELPEPDMPQGPKLLQSTLQFLGTREELEGLKQYMSTHGIAYKKVFIFPTHDDAAVYMRNKGITGIIQAAIVLG